jgi:hypothetical protein
VSIEIKIFYKATVVLQTAGFFRNINAVVGEEFMYETLKGKAIKMKSKSIKTCC